MAQVFFGQWGNALASMPYVALPVRKQSGSEITVPATNGAQTKATETVAKSARKNAEPASNGSQKATKTAIKDAPKGIKTEVTAKNANTATAAKQAQKSTETDARGTQKTTATAAKGAQKTTELAAKDTQKSAQRAEKAAGEAQKATETVVKSAQKNTEPASNGSQKSAEKATFPIDGYDDMNVGDVSESLEGLSTDELKRVRKYEKDNKDRVSLRKEMKQKIEASS
jgi:hypothetical protein